MCVVSVNPVVSLIRCVQRGGPRRAERNNSAMSKVLPNPSSSRRLCQKERFRKLKRTLITKGNKMMAISDCKVYILVTRRGWWYAGDTVHPHDDRTSSAESARRRKEKFRSQRYSIAKTICDIGKSCQANVFVYITRNNRWYSFEARHRKVSTPPFHTHDSSGMLIETADGKRGAHGS